MARTVSAVLALIGAVLVGVSSFVPLYRFSEGSYKIFEFDADPKSLLFFGLEPSFVAVAAAAVGILALTTGRRVFGAFLTGIGAQTIALFVSYFGWMLLDGDGSPDPGIGAFLGLLGGGAILAGGLVAWLSAAAPEPVAAGVPRSVSAPGAAPAGWYPDPSGTARLRYWTGASWSGETSE